MTRRQLLGGLGGVFLAGLLTNKAEACQDCFNKSELYQTINRAVEHHCQFLEKKELASRIGLNLDEWRAVTHAIIRHESSYRPDAVNEIPEKNIKSIGLMQINIRFWGRQKLLEGIPEEKLLTPYWNVRTGLMIFTYELLRSKSVGSALYRYVGGHDSEYVVNVLETAFLMKGDL